MPHFNPLAYQKPSAMTQNANNQHKIQNRLAAISAIFRSFPQFRSKNRQKGLNTL
jgi:hypothetical protein